MGRKNPYLEADRIQDVIAAITVMAVKEQFMQTPRGWAVSICGDAGAEGRWKRVFKEHGEFFRFDVTDQKVSLVLRGQKPSVQSKQDPSKSGREPLTESEVEMLVGIAISLQTNALNKETLDRNWVPVALGGAFTLLGTLIPSIVKFINNLI